MSSGFDAYHKWLGIPPKDQPPNHYRLLGLEPFESDPDVIEAVADQRMAHVRQYQTGPHSALSQQILNELATAKLRLLTPSGKQSYDESLRQLLAATTTMPSAPPAAYPMAPIAPAPAAVVPVAPYPISAPPQTPLAAPLVSDSPSAVVGRHLAHPRRRSAARPWMGVVGAAVVAAVVIAFVARAARQQNTPQVAGPPVDQPGEAVAFNQEQRSPPRHDRTDIGTQKSAPTVAADDSTSANRENVAITSSGMARSTSGTVKTDDVSGSRPTRATAAELEPHVPVTTEQPSAEIAGVDAGDKADVEGAMPEQPDYDELWSEVGPLLSKRDYAAARARLQQVRDDPAWRAHEHTLVADLADVERLQGLLDRAEQKIGQIEPGQTIKAGGMPNLKFDQYDATTQTLMTHLGKKERKTPLADVRPDELARFLGDDQKETALAMAVLNVADRWGNAKEAQRLFGEASAPDSERERWLARLEQRQESEAKPMARGKTAEGADGASGRTARLSTGKEKDVKNTAGAPPKAVGIPNIAIGPELRFRRMKGHNGAVSSVLFLANGIGAVSSSYDGTILTWDLTSGKQVGFFVGHTAAVSGLALVPNTTLMVSTSFDKTARLWNLFNGELVRGYGKAKELLTSVAVSPDGQLVAVGAETGSLYVYHRQNGREQLKLTDLGPGTINSLAFTSDGKQLVFGHGATVRVLELSKKESVVRFTGHAEPVSSVSLSFDNARAVSGSWDGSTKVWELANGREIKQWKETSSVHAVAFSPNAQQVLTAAGGKFTSLTTFDTLNAGNMLFLRDLSGSTNMIMGSSSPVRTVCWSADGRYYLSGDQEGTVSLQVVRN